MGDGEHIEAIYGYRIEIRRSGLDNGQWDLYVSVGSEELYGDSEDPAGSVKHDEAERIGVLFPFHVSHRG